MLEVGEVKRLKNDLRFETGRWDREHDHIEDAACVVGQIIHDTEFNFNGAELVEVRAEGRSTQVSAPINIAGVRFRVGQSQSVRHDVMTVIDAASFVIGSEPRRLSVAVSSGCGSTRRSSGTTPPGATRC